MNVTQQALTFACEGEWLVGIVSRPPQPRPRGVLIVVGGPQYRVGSHRQFALLANRLAGQGTPVMRFDYRGMGDSSGESRDFEQVNPDLRAAVDAFFDVVPGLQDVVIWGLCDAASAASFYAHEDPRVSGVVLLNPWVRTPAGEARAYFRHYYLQRLSSAALWRKLLRGDFDWKGSAKSLISSVGRALNAGGTAEPPEPGALKASPKPSSSSAKPLPERMVDGLSRFNGRVLVILSGNDLTAGEFIDVSGASKPWRRVLASSRVTRHTLADATHTFSRRDWRDQAAAWTEAWVRSW